MGCKLEYGLVLTTYKEYNMRKRVFWCEIGGFFGENQVKLEMKKNSVIGRRMFII